MTRGTRAFAAAALATAALLAAGCGDDDSTTATDETTATTATTATAEDATAETTVTGGIADATSALESAGYDVREEPASDLDTVTGTAQAGAVATKPGEPGDAVIFEWADEKEAAAYAKANNDDILTTEVVGTLTVSSVTSNTDMLDDVVATIGD